MMVETRLFANFREITKKERVSISADSVNELIEKLCQDYGELESEFFTDVEERELKNNINITVNGSSIKGLDGLETELEEEDIVSIFPPVSGG